MSNKNFDVAGPLPGHWDGAALRWVYDVPAPVGGWAADPGLDVAGPVKDAPTAVEGSAATRVNVDPTSGPDGNGNGIPNEYGDGPDLDGNGVPDEIGINPDSLQPGYPGGLPDGNGNGIPGEYGDGPDLDGNGVADEIGINPDMLQENYHEGHEWGGVPLDPIGPVALNPQPLPPVDPDNHYYQEYARGAELLNSPLDSVALNPQPLPPVDPDRFEDAFAQFDDSMYF